MTPPLKRVDHLPDGRAGLCYLLFAEGRGRLFVVGPSTRALYTRPDPFVLAIHVALPPGGAYRYLGVPLDALADRHVPARDVWGAPADRLLDELFALGGDLDPRVMRARVAAIDAALGERRRVIERHEPAAAALVRAAASRLAQAGSPIRDLASELHISDRNLRRAFATAVGVSPKQYARIARFRRAMAHASAAQERWANVAHIAGYADQAHLANEFRELAGVSPSAFARPDAADHLRIACPMAGSTRLTEPSPPRPQRPT
jgi:AraC-like DNA-binding protein